MNLKLSFTAVLLLLVATFSLLLPAKATMVGGYSSIATDDDGAVKAANFAVNNVYGTNVISHRIIAAGRQVVAGLNYQLTVYSSLRDPSHGCKSDTFVVYNHFGELSVTSRTENPEGCQ